MQVLKQVIGEYNLFINETVDVTVGLSPVRPKSGSLSFARNPHMPLPNVTGTATPGPANPSENITARRCEVTLTNADGTAQPMVSVDVTNGPGTFACLVDQTYSGVFFDTNSSGDSPASDPVSGKVSVGGGGGNVPTKPTGGTITFAEAP